jgi:hypothetical protein
MGRTASTTRRAPSMAACGNSEARRSCFSALTVLTKTALRQAPVGRASSAWASGKSGGNAWMAWGRLCHAPADGRPRLRPMSLCPPAGRAQGDSMPEQSRCMDSPPLPHSGIDGRSSPGAPGRPAFLQVRGDVFNRHFLAEAFGASQDVTATPSHLRLQTSRLLLHLLRSAEG